MYRGEYTQCSSFSYVTKILYAIVHGMKYIEVSKPFSLNTKNKTKINLIGFELQFCLYKIYFADKNVIMHHMHIQYT